MSTRSLDRFIALAGAVVLSLGLMGPAVAEEDVSPSPASTLVPAAEHEAVDALVGMVEERSASADAVEASDGD